jgi:hypothetical protein
MSAKNIAAHSYNLDKDILLRGVTLDFEKRSFVVNIFLEHVMVAS